MRVCDKCGHRAEHTVHAVDDQVFDLCRNHSDELMLWFGTRDPVIKPAEQPRRGRPRRRTKEEMA